MFDDVAPSTQLLAFYEKAWGRPWPSRQEVISTTDIHSDTAMVIDDDSDSQATPVNLTYKVYSGITEVVEALIMPLSTGRILVAREEYMFLRKQLEDMFAAIPLPHWAAVVTGHPGIGKTMFLVYLLLCRLESKSPTAVQVDNDQYYIFDEQGVSIFRLNQFPTRLRRCWALVDSNESVVSPCTPCTRMAEYVVLTTLPEPSRWKTWLKYRGGEIIVSELPTTLEIAAIARELGFDPRAACRWGEKWGPSTRNIIELLMAGEGLEEKFESNAETASSTVWQSPGKLDTVLSDPQSLASTGSAVVFLRPAWEDGQRLSFTSRPFIPTNYLADIFETCGSKLQIHAALKLFDMLSPHSLTRSPDGWLFEKMMHEHLCRGVKAITINKCGGPARTMGMTPARELITGTVNGLASAGASASFYWLPIASNFPGIDGVLGDRKRNLFAVQATTASEHTCPVEGLRKVWEVISKRVGESRSWHFVVVADTRATAQKLGPKMAKALETFTLGTHKKTVDVWCCSL
ncbi:hypothetical protein GGX14DRAFT_540146 [Mycena pura]|uniref:Uncharacterized protein n=1 Tax=Mycena pura TaxID=153505 RepID=A0AAD6YLJ0_9AGAR|nr:hypothetical protein GGX14DRAFT_540146 [Mycena pura]